MNFLTASGFPNNLGQHRRFTHTRQSCNFALGRQVRRWIASELPPVGSSPIHVLQPCCRWQDFVVVTVIWRHRWPQLPVHGERPGCWRSSIATIPVRMDTCQPRVRFVGRNLGFRIPCALRPPRTALRPTWSGLSQEGSALIILIHLDLSPCFLCNSNSSRSTWLERICGKLHTSSGRQQNPKPTSRIHVILIRTDAVVANWGKIHYFNP